MTFWNGKLRQLRQGEQELRHSIRIEAEGLNLSLRLWVPSTVHLSSSFSLTKGNLQICESGNMQKRTGKKN